jgi:hypothetical protein
MDVSDVTEVELRMGSSWVRFKPVNSLHAEFSPQKTLEALLAEAS